MAAIDLGSNSFHLLLGLEERGEVRVVDRIKERVALAAGLSETGSITEAAKARALDCLARFSQRLVGLRPTRVRAVGTNTFRAAKDGGEFLEQASRTLGFPIEIVSGSEEARLIYAGVRSTSGFYERHILVVDIGGGSTELVVGKGERAQLAESLRMGCVVWSERFFPAGVVDEARFQQAQREARLVMRSVRRRLFDAGAELFVGSSGTALAIAGVVASAGWESDGEDPKRGGFFTRTGLLRLRQELVEAGSTKALGLPGLSPTREGVLPGGVAIMCAVFEALEIERMIVSDGALREGLVAELVGRLHHKDVREATVAAMAERFSVDMPQADRVASTSAQLFEVARKPWRLRRRREGVLLRWGARLHELGLSVCHDGYRKHGSYLVAHADLAGFTRNEQSRLAALVLSQRGRLRPEVFAPFRPELRDGLIAATLLLRVARLLHRSRSSRPLPPWAPKARVQSGCLCLELGIPAGWFEQHALTRADLAAEALEWQRLGHELRLEG